jgi:glycosyltransferase involved in cell wall biosynthesis
LYKFWIERPVLRWFCAARWKELPAGKIWAGLRVAGQTWLGLHGLNAHIDPYKALGGPQDSSGDILIVRIAVFTTCPKDAFSGGRYHSMMIAQVLARRGHDVHFITNNRPIFLSDIAPISVNNPVRIVVTEEFDVSCDGVFDAVFIAPQMAFFPRFYKNAIRFAEETKAALFLINYESANWFNTFSPVKRPYENWREWVDVAKQGACILSSTHESEKYARDYYTDLPPGSDFAVWQPAINSVACAAVPEQTREKLIVLFSRPSDKHKGGGDIEDLISPELSGYRIGIVIGNAKNSEEFLKNLRVRGQAAGVEIEPYFSISDEEKFTLLKRASAVLFPSYFEGYGYPPMEALAADTPCVAYDLPVVRENCRNLIRYAPVGDVSALRRELLAALQATAVKTSTDPLIYNLNDVDERGKALETVIETYFARRAAALRVPSTNVSDGFRLQPASLIRVNERAHVVFSMTTHNLLTTAEADEDDIVSAGIFRGAWTAQGWRYDVFLTLAPNCRKDISNLSIIIRQAFSEVPIRLPLAGLTIAKSGIPWLSQNTYALTKAFKNGRHAILSGWAFPEKPYDSLYLMDRYNRVIKLQTAIKNLAYQKKFYGPLTGFCGFMSSTIDLENYDIESMRLIVMRHGAVAARGRLNATAVLKSPEHLAMISAGQKPAAEIAKSFDKDTQNATAVFHGLEQAEDTSIPQISQKFLHFRIINAIRGGIFRHMPRLKIPAVFKAKKGIKPEKIIVDGVELKWALNDCDYIKDSDQLSISGWVNLPDAVRVEIWSDDSKLIGVATNGGARPDVAANLKISERDDFGFNYSAKYGGDLNATMMIRLLQGPRILAERVVKGLKVKSGLKFKVEDFAFDQTWNVLWMRGMFETQTSRLERLEILHGGMILAEAAIDEKFQPDGKRLFKWRLEAIVDDPIPPGNGLIVRATLIGGQTIDMTYKVPVEQSNYIKTEGLKPEQLDFADPSELLDTLEFLGPAPDPTCDRTILLVVHNLNAVERAEKRTALELLRSELNSVGVELIVLHHSKYPSGCLVPEINFFSESLRQAVGLLSTAPGTGSSGRGGRFRHRTTIDQNILNYAQRMLFGFTDTLNRSPKPWSDAEAQTLEELEKIDAVIRIIKPSLTLLWHQWNSLMLLGRAVSDKHNIPTAIIHEGMLPGTMTIDSNGMMAESDSAGVMIDPEQVDTAPYFAQARYVIGQIHDKRLDRKPHAGAPAALQIVRKLKADGKKIVFYAGVNDWQSGNLPADHARAQIHAPYYSDTFDALEALLETAERLDFIVLYKPHPNLYPRPIGIDHERLIYVREANASDCILETDVTATLLSSLAYISLAHGVPTVLMGRNTLSGAHAAYEFEDYKTLDDCLRDALDRHALDARLLRFEGHVAALLKHHLYPYGDLTNFAVLSYRDSAQKLLDIIDGAQKPGH